MPKVLFNIRNTIMKSGRAEFVERGFEQASIRTICRNAGVTTGALYSNFGSKEGLFDAIASEFTNQYDPLNLLSFEEPLGAAEVARMEMGFIRFAIEHREDMLMLLFCSQGTSYENFRDDLTERFVLLIRAYLTFAGIGHDERLVYEVACAEVGHCIALVQASHDEGLLDATSQRIESYFTGALQGLAVKA